MGAREDRGDRLAEHDERSGRYTWRRGSGPGAASVGYTKGGGVRLEAGGRSLEIPFGDARWLAEVLLQVTDLDPVFYASDAHDDYNRSSMARGDRR